MSPQGHFQHGLAFSSTTFKHHRIEIWKNVGPCNGTKAEERNQISYAPTQKYIQEQFYTLHKREREREREREIAALDDRDPYVTD